MDQECIKECRPPGEGTRARRERVAQAHAQNP